MLEIGKQWTFSMVFPWFLRLRLWIAPRYFHQPKGLLQRWSLGELHSAPPRGPSWKATPRLAMGWGQIRPDSGGWGVERPHMTSLHSLRIRVVSGVLAECCWWVHSFSVKPESPWKLWRASSVRSRAGSTSEAAAVICSDVSWLTCHFGHFGQTVNWFFFSLRVDPQFCLPGEKGSLSWLLGAYVRSGLHVTSMQLPLAWQCWSQQNREIHRDLPHTLW